MYMCKSDFWIIKNEMIGKYLIKLQNVWKQNSSCATQPTFTCSKLTIETLEQAVKYAQMTPMASFWYLYC